MHRPRPSPAPAPPARPDRQTVGQRVHAGPLRARSGTSKVTLPCHCTLIQLILWRCKCGGGADKFGDSQSFLLSPSPQKKFLEEDFIRKLARDRARAPIPFRLYTFRPCPFPDTHRPLSPSSPLPGGGYGVRHGNPGMLRRDLVNMRARMRPPRVRPERCPSCIHLDGVHILPSRCSSKAKGNFVCTFALISHLDLIFILQPQRSSPSLVANPCLVGKRDGPPPAPPHSLSRCLMPSCLPAWQSSFTPSARGPSAVRQRDYIRVRVERAFSLRINRVRGRRAASAAASLFLLSR